MYKKILVPLDGSPLAEAVLPHAQALAKAENAEIVILRVAMTPDEHYLMRNRELTSGIVDDIENEAKNYVQREVELLEKDGTKVTGITRDGPVADAILEAAAEAHVDVIAMSTHGRSGVQRWLLGSVADRVVHYSHIPVMLIHPN
jgi:nucleotide-binding universal stress UspA family protein